MKKQLTLAEKDIKTTKIPLQDKDSKNKIDEKKIRLCKIQDILEWFLLTCAWKKGNIIEQSIILNGKEGKELQKELTNIKLKSNEKELLLIKLILSEGSFGKEKIDEKKDYKMTIMKKQEDFYIRITPILNKREINTYIMSKEEYEKTIQILKKVELYVKSLD